jgi:hypothetical protein
MPKIWGGGREQKVTLQSCPPTVVRKVTLLTRLAYCAYCTADRDFAYITRRMWALAIGANFNSNVSKEIDLVNAE